MELKARIISRESVEVTDIEQETAKVEHTYQTAKQMGGLTDERIAELQAKTPGRFDRRRDGQPGTLAGIETEYERAKERLGLFLSFIQTDTPNTVDTDTPIPYYEDRDGSVVQLWNHTKRSGKNSIEDRDTKKRARSDRLPGDQITGVRAGRISPGIRHSIPTRTKTRDPRRNKHT